MLWAPSHWRCAHSTFFTPISTKALKGVQPSPLVTGHTQDTVAAPSPFHSPAARQPLPTGTARSKWPSPISDLAVRHWLYPPHRVPAGGEHTPWDEQQGKPPLPCRGLWQGGDTAEYPQGTGSLGLSRIYFKASANRARVRTIHSPPCSSSFLLKP